MRLLSRLLIVLAICFVAVALPAAPVQAQGEYILLSPNIGVPGERVTIYGHCFTAQRYVDIFYDGSRLRELYLDGTPSDDVRTDDDGYFEVDFFVPESYTGGHVVRAEDVDDVYATDYFTVEPGLTIEPEEGPVGTTVTVEGHGFAEEEENIDLLYYLNGTAEVVGDSIEANRYGYWDAVFQVPSSASGDHYINAWGDDTELRDVEDVSFEVIPEISIIDPASGSVIEEPSGSAGDEVTMIGTGFYADDMNINILFAGYEMETEPEIIKTYEYGNWTATFEVPELPRDTYSVTAKGQSTREGDVNELTFTIAPGLLLSPDEGHVGMNVTVTGGGFAPDEPVVIKYDGADLEPPTTARTNEQGGFKASFLVPESQHGAHNVTAEIDGETEAFATFTMENDAPGKPELSSPPDGTRLGFIGKVRLTFNWSAVEDLSGVRYYNLQIATSGNITDTGFADPFREISNIIGTNYTLEKTEALPHGTYYWRVQAVDGAENEGGWTEARSFRIGVIPLWAFIAIIVVVAGGIGALIYFRVIRQRIYYY